jgi:hypothetical protein
VACDSPNIIACELDALLAGAGREVRSGSSEFDAVGVRQRRPHPILISGSYDRCAGIQPHSTFIDAYRKKLWIFHPSVKRRQVKRLPIWSPASWTEFGKPGTRPALIRLIY